MKRNNSLKDVLKPKDLRNPYILAGIAGRIATVSRLDSANSKVIDKVIHKVVLPVPENKSLDYTSSDLWHGTGRYKYNKDSTVDVLAEIAKSGYILPNLDKFDINRPMVTVSLAKSRMYARAYADMHGCGSREENRYGSSLFWACSFLGSVAVEASKETKVWKPSGYYRMLGHLADANTVEWYKNITRVPNPSVISVYQDGSDICDNYPILFNVKEVPPALTSKAVSLHEVRTEQPIDLVKDIHHIEVPYDRLEETRDLMPGISVLPIELGEDYCSRYYFSQHMHEVV